MTPQDAMVAIARDRDINALITQPELLRGLLMDLCNGGNRREFNLLVHACHSRVPQGLLSLSTSAFETDHISHLARRMVDDHATSPESARWAVETWALALSVFADTLTDQTTSDSGWQTVSGRESDRASELPALALSSEPAAAISRATAPHVVTLPATRRRLFVSLCGVGTVIGLGLVSYARTTSVAPEASASPTLPPKPIDEQPSALGSRTWQSIGEEPIGSDGAKGTAPGEFSAPTGVAIGPSGEIWVADTMNHRIQVRESGGGWRIAAGKPGGGERAKGTDAGEFSVPRGVAISGDGTVWVADSANHRIQALAPQDRWQIRGGKPLRGIAAAGISPGEFNTPTGITVDGKGAVWVVEHGNHRVQVLEPGGTWQIVAGKIGGGGAAIGSGLGEFRYPTGIAVDGYGAVWIADAGNHRVQTMAQDGIWTVRGGKPEGGVGSIGKGIGEFSSPTGIAAGLAGAVWVVEFGNHRVQMLAPGERWRIVGGKPGGGDGAKGAGLGEFSSPTGITVDENGTVWVADEGNHRIQWFGMG